MKPDDLAHRLDAIDARLQRIEATLLEVQQLRTALAHERESRRALAEQTTWLVELLESARRDPGWIRAEAPKRPG